MARLLLRDEWYEPLSLHAQYESEFQRILLAYAEALFPGWHLVPFAVDVRSDEGVVKRADLALIDRDYRRWWVVEVEMARHDFNGHVLPQVRVLSFGKYGQAHVAALLRRGPHLDASRVADMVRGEQPRVWVLVDRPRPDWIRPLSVVGAALGVVEIFRSDNGQHSFRLNGEQPQPPATATIECRKDPLVHQLWTVTSPALLPILDGQTMDIFMGAEGRRFRWMRKDTASTVYLSCTNGNPLQDHNRVDLLWLEDERWVFIAGQHANERTI
jgi:hypothetical protein